MAKKIRTAHYQYKCRMCGEIYDKCCGGEHKTQNILEMMFAIRESDIKPKTNVEIAMLDIHVSCRMAGQVSDETSALGVGDFIGIYYTD